MKTLKFTASLIEGERVLGPSHQSKLARVGRHPFTKSWAHTIAMLLALTLAATAQAEDYTYTTNSGTITINGYTGSDTVVVIPYTINGLPVTTIGTTGTATFYPSPNLRSVAIRNVVVQNGIVRNFDDGVHAEYAQDSRFERLITASNRNYGVYLLGYPGWCGGNKVADCTIRRNAERGIFIHGAYQNRVEGNHITGQIGATTYGIYCNRADKNLIVCNTCVGQTTNFVMSANDTYGPIVTTSGPLSTTGADAHPWANFSR